MKSIPIRRRHPLRLLVLGALAAAAVAMAASPAAAARPIPAAGAAIQHASLDWTGDLAMQGPNHGLPNFFSAGLSEGTEATYKGSDGNATVLLEKEGKAPATWATHTNYSTAAGERQVVRLTEGKGRVEPDGSAEISWDATFSVNYYGELTPFSIEDPKLTVDADGTGELTATLIGCAADRTTNECIPFPPVPDAQVATFEGVAINSLGEVTIDPDWAEVEVETGSATPQNRTAADWGAWPQSFVDFQLETGLSSFFYSSGSNSSEKVPLPFVVDFDGPTRFEHATLDWVGNTVMQSTMFGFHNYFSAGASDGTEATYKGAEGNASIYLEAEGPGTVATWATHENYGPAAGEEQVAHLSEGVGEVESDGAAEVRWHGTFSVNFYGGLVPFSIEDPQLVVDADGTGELTATLLGCASSQANPTDCVALPPEPEVQVATFSGAKVNRQGELTILPDYEGVAVDTGAAAPQNRTEEGWGAWPQPFVDFQLETELSSYWYSSGGGDDVKKPPLPFFVGLGVEVEPEEEEGNGNEEEGSGGKEEDTSAGGGAKPTDKPSSSPDGPGATASSTAPPVRKRAKVRHGKGVTRLTAGGIAKVATLTCPAGGTACKPVVRHRVGVKIGGKRYVLTVIAPQRVGAGRSVAIRVRLPKAARKALGGKKLTIKLSITVYANGRSTHRVMRAKVAGRR